MLTSIMLARGGSKGLPNKNLATIDGVSLIAIAVRKSNQVADRTIVSTDSVDIASEAAANGAEIIDRPARLATDEASSLDGLKHAIEDRSVSGRVLWIQCTAPLATSEHYRDVSEQHSKADVAVAVNEFHGFILSPLGRCLNAPLSTIMPRRQDMDNQYVISGSAWAFDASYALSTDNIYSGSIQPVLCRGPHCDIDTQEDLDRARLLYRAGEYDAYARLMG